MDYKVFQIMPYIIIRNVRTFHKPNADCFSIARQKPVGGRGGGGGGKGEGRGGGGHSVCNNLGYCGL